LCHKYARLLKSFEILTAHSLVGHLAVHALAATQGPSVEGAATAEHESNEDSSEQGIDDDVALPSTAKWSITSVVPCAGISSPLTNPAMQSMSNTQVSQYCLKFIYNKAVFT
jgi:hypothetical protein